jgi:HAE1 family hydrophobic/amphiphilic exporter-1
MNIAQISIRRPVFVVMLMAFFVVVGMVSCSKLGLNMMPKVKIPYITVMTTYPGASPDVIATEITKKIEDRVAVVEGIDTLTSYSMESVSVVVIKFVSGKDVETAAQDVRDKVALARADLPDTVDDPIIGKVDLNAMPIMTYTLSSDTMGERELRDYVRTQVVDSLQQVSGVASVSIQGGLEREIRVVLDPARMNAYGLNPSLVGQMLLATNVNIPAGTIRQGGLEYVLRQPSEFQSVEDIRKTVVFSSDSMTVRLGDIATISDSQKEQTVAARLNGKSSVNLQIVQRSDADTVTTAEGAKHKVEVLKSQMPPGITILLTSDYSRYVVSALEDIQFSIILGAILASFSVWLFVGKMRHTIPITISILVSIIAAYSVINFSGFTLNFISMLALAVAVGLVVDDAIVVQENLLKVYEQTGDREKATVQGIAEVALAVLAATSTLIAVFLPIGFMTGMIGQFFKEFGVTVAAAVAISLVVSLVLIPLIFYHFTSAAHHEGERGVFLRIIDFFSRLFNPIHLGFLKAYLLLEERYEGFLRAALRRRAMVVAIAAGFFLLTIPLLKLVQVGFLPPSDQGTFSISIELPVEADFDSTDAIVRKVETRVKELPEVESVVSLVEWRPAYRWRLAV